MTEPPDQTGRRALVVGPGAIGTVLAVRLARGGCAVTVLDHRADRAARIRREGLALVAEGQTLRAAVEATTSAASAASPDLVLVCVKCPALESAGRALAALAAPSTVVTIENGLGVLESLQRGLASGGAARVRHTLVAAVTWQAACRGPDGLVRHVANLPTLLDGSPAVRGAAEEARTILESGGLPTRIETDLRRTVWRKLLVNAAINPVTALAHVANGRLAEPGELRERMLALAREAARAARAEGLDIGDEEAARLALAAARATADNVSSMRQDVESGRPTEIEFLSGAVLMVGLRHGLTLPETARAVADIRRLRPS